MEVLVRIVYLSQYFPPEIGAPSARVFELAKHWVGRGHQVSVLTAFPHHPHGVKRPQDRGVLTRREEIAGIDVMRSYIWAAANQGTTRRIASYLSFMASSVLVGTMRLPRPDVLVATSPQFFCAVGGWMLARLNRVPFVFEVRDLWPESVLAVGAMREGVAVKCTRRIAAMLYRSAARIVTLGEGYRRRIHQLYGVPLGHMDVIPNGLDSDLFYPRPRDNEVRRRYGWQDQFVCLYLGTHGMAHALDRVLDVADRLRGDPRIRFVFVGDGAEKSNLVQKQRARSLHNVQFLPAQDRRHVPEFYAAADLCLVTLRKQELFEDVLPSKIFEILGMGRPLVLSVDGEARRLVETAGAGVFVPPEDVAAMATAIDRLRGAPTLCEQMGHRGRQFVMQHYPRSVLADRYLDILENVRAEGTGRARAAPRVGRIAHVFSTYSKPAVKRSA